MASYTEYRYQFNGVISTDKTVMQNLESMCTAAGSWPAYDIHTGLWSVVINKAGTSVKSFYAAADVIGPINVSGSGLTQLYNKVKVQFPHIDLNDNPDYTIIEIPTGDRNANEPDNTLNMQLDVINDPVQAQLIGGINLKQSRVDKIIRFQTDYSKLGLKAGDLIDISAGVYGFENKMFRITSIAERDDDAGAILLDITALEYDANVYDTSDLSRYVISNSTGITSIGAMGAPGTPTIDKVERNSRPNITVHTTTPSGPTGIVEAIEFWTTTDVPPGNNVDSTRHYTLIGTVRPTTGTSFPFGTAVSLNIDSLAANNFLVKARGINSATTGPFSAPAAFVYTPVQTTDAIGPDTQAVDATGALVTTLAVTYLLNHLDDVWKGISTPGSLFDKIMGIYDSVTGGNLISLGTPGGSVTSISPTTPAAADGYAFSSIGTGEWVMAAPGVVVSNTATSYGYSVTNDGSNFIISAPAPGGWDGNIRMGTNAAAAGWTAAKSGSDWIIEMPSGFGSGGLSTGTGISSFVVDPGYEALTGITSPDTTSIEVVIKATGENDQNFTGTITGNTWTAPISGGTFTSNVMYTAYVTGTMPMPTTVVGTAIASDSYVAGIGAAPISGVVYVADEVPGAPLTTTTVFKVFFNWGGTGNSGHAIRFYTGKVTDGVHEYYDGTAYDTGFGMGIGGTGKIADYGGVYLTAGTYSAAYFEVLGGSHIGETKTAPSFTVT